MVDRPIIFSAPMVRALLDGRKTMTRRLAWRTPFRCAACLGIGCICDGSCGKPETCPSPWQRVQPGDRLWVREAWRSKCGEEHPECVIYRATDADLTRDVNNGSGRFRPSIHMPRWASRLTLTVTAKRIEKLRAITNADAVAEGVESRGRGSVWVVYDGDQMIAGAATPRMCFSGLWDHLHGKKAGRANPEIVAVSFTVEHRNIDA